MEGWVLGTLHDFRVRRLEASDLPFVVNQHLQNVSEGLFARLVTRFLTGHYLPYCPYSTAPSACSVVAVHGDDTVGFLVGTSDPVGHRQHLLRAHGRLLLREGRPCADTTAPPNRTVPADQSSAVSTETCSPSPTPRISPAADPSGRAAVLCHMVIAPSHQGRGNVSALVEELQVAARHAGCDRRELVAHAGGPGATHYERTGWSAMGQHRTPDGTLLITFVRSRPDPDAAKDSTEHAPS